MRKIRLHFSGAHSISFFCFTRQIPLLVTCYCCVGHIKCLFNSKILFVIFNINMILNTYGKPPETNLWHFFKMFVLCTLSVFSCYSYSNGNYSLMSITCWRFTKGSFEAKLSVSSFFFCFLFFVLFFSLFWTRRAHLLTRAASRPVWAGRRTSSQPAASGPAPGPSSL